jgi:hypothetical protein
MKYEYDGINEFEGYKLRSDIPKEEWKFGTEVNIELYQPERSKREDSKDDHCLFCGRIYTNIRNEKDCCDYC